MKSKLLNFRGKLAGNSMHAAAIGRACIYALFFCEMRDDWAMLNGVVIHAMSPYPMPHCHIVPFVVEAHFLKNLTYIIFLLSSRSGRGKLSWICWYCFGFQIPPCLRFCLGWSCAQAKIAQTGKTRCFKTGIPRVMCAVSWTYMMSTLARKVYQHATHEVSQWKMARYCVIIPGMLSYSFVAFWAKLHFAIVPTGDFAIAGVRTILPTKCLMMRSMFMMKKSSNMLSYLSKKYSNTDN